MLFPVIAFVLGTVLIARVPVLLPLDAGLISVPLLIYGLKTRLVLPCSFLLGAGWGFCALQVEIQHREDIARLMDGAGEQGVVVRGVVTDLPLVSEHSVRFHLRLIDSNRRVRVYWYQPGVNLVPGQIWRLSVRLREPTGAVNFDTFDYEKWLFAKRIHGLGYVLPDNEQVLIGYRAGVDTLRHRIRQKLQGVVPPNALPTFLALALGDTSLLRPEEWSILNRTGTTHLLIVSGLHVGLIASLTYLVCRVLGLGLAWTIGIAISTTAVYALLAGWGLPVQRALVMTVVYLSSGLLVRHISLLSRLSLAALFVVILDPVASLSAGFWLSFGVVAALILAFSNRSGDQGAMALGRSQWIAFIALLPLLGGLNHQLPLVSLPVNMIAIPVVGFVLVPLIFLSLIAGIAFESLSQLPVSVAHWITVRLWQFLEFAASFDGLVEIAAPDRWRILAALGGAALLLMPRGLLPRWLGIPLMLLLLEQPAPLESGTLRVTFLDVGQGLSVLLETRHGASLYDTGPFFAGAFSAADQIVLPALRGRGWHNLEQLIISHSDNDHAGGRDSILASVPVRQVIQESDCADQWERDSVWFVSFSAGLPESSNDESCLLLVVASGFRLLLTGDIETRGEMALLSRLKMPVDIISAPHHGSDSSSSPALLNTLIPSIAVISAGYRNRFGHPDTSIVRRYENRSVSVLSTAESGAVQIYLQPGGMIISEARSRMSGVWRRHTGEQNGSQSKTGKHR